MFRLYRLYGLKRPFREERLFHAKQSLRLSRIYSLPAYGFDWNNRYISHVRHNILRKAVRRFWYDNSVRHTGRYCQHRQARRNRHDWPAAGGPLGTAGCAAGGMTVA